jgi:hypothetical protein
VRAELVQAGWTAARGVLQQLLEQRSTRAANALTGERLHQTRERTETPARFDVGLLHLLPTLCFSFEQDSSVHTGRILYRDASSAIAIALALGLTLATFTVAPVFADDTRELPDYAGREERTSVGDVLIWVPRVVLSPLYLVSEFVIRRPIGGLISLAERNQVPEALYDFFTFTPDRKVGIVPTFFVDFGFKPSAGFYLFWDDFLAHGNDLRVHAATWGPEWLAAGLTDRVKLGAANTLQLDFSAVRRQDYRFYGEGPSSRERDISRYGASRFQGDVTFVSKLGEGNVISLSAGLRKVSFHDPSGPYVATTERVAQGRFPEPKDLSDGYAAEFSRLRLRLDTRKAHSRTGSGVRLEAGIEQGSAFDAGPQNWLKYGGSLAGYFDVNERGRILTLALTSLFCDRLTHQRPPFDELVQLGGSGPMPGFLPGRLVGRSAAVATLSYHWPIWVWLNGNIQASVGNVFDAHLQDFRPSMLRFSSAIGIETAGVSDNPIQILFGLGTETFDSCAKLTAMRLVFGTTHEYF